MKLDAPVCAAMLLRGRCDIDAAIEHALTLAHAEQRRSLYEVAPVFAPADMSACGWFDVVSTANGPVALTSCAKIARAPRRD